MSVVIITYVFIIFIVTMVVGRDEKCCKTWFLPQSSLMSIEEKYIVSLSADTDTDIFYQHVELVLLYWRIQVTRSIPLLEGFVKRWQKQLPHSPTFAPALHSPSPWKKELKDSLRFLGYALFVVRSYSSLP